jgi:CheY-like chemotaxis protein
MSVSTALNAGSPDRGTRVLLVEDDPDLLAISADILEAAGYEVTQAASGEAALDLVADGGFDVLVTDNAMPGMTGGALLRQATALRPGIRGLLVSGYGDMAAVGEFPVLRKPFRAAELGAALRGLADAHPCVSPAKAAA